MWAVTLFVIFVALPLLILHWYQTRSHVAKLLNAFPGDPMIPILGQVFLFSRKRDKQFLQLRNSLKKYNETFRQWSLHYSILHITKAEDAEIILSSIKLIEKSIIYDFLQPWLGTGLLTSTGSKWQHRRKILTPTFHFNILRKFVEVFGEHCDKIVLQLQDECKKPKTNINPLITKFTLSTICETAMGTRLNDSDEKQRKYFTAVYNLGPILINRSVSPWYYFDIIFNLSPSGWLQRMYVKILHHFTESVIKEREQNFKDEDVENLEIDVSSTPKKRLAMLDLLLSAKRKRNEIDNEGIREEVDTFMFEGHDTTSMAICYILLTLANHKDIQERIIMELDEIFGTSKKTASYEDLQKLKYTELCIKECLRLYPSVPLISRLLKEDTPLSKHTAPAGVTAIIHIYDIHRDERYYPDPEKFDPNRFLPENSKDRHPYAYVPFSAGPRNCIGQKYAILELKSVVCCILRNFRMEPVTSLSDVTWLTDMVLRTSNNIYIKFVTRDMEY